MTPRQWLTSRTPVPPSGLRARLDEALHDAGSSTDDLPESYLRAAERLIEDLLQGECTSRDSALDLLTADALVTYAFEAAGETPASLVPRARAAMRRIASLGASRRAGADAK
jgi:hypothetical protein